VEALEKLGAPVAAADAQQLAALTLQKDSAAVEAAERILGRYTLSSFAIESAGSVRVTAGQAPRTLIEQGWRIFLVRIANMTKNTNTPKLTTYGGVNNYVVGATPGRMGVWSDGHFSSRAFLLDTLNKGPLIESMWVTTKLDNTEALLGIPIEYRAVEIFSRDHGLRKAQLIFDVPS
jgi:hypothetical protein